MTLTKELLQAAADRIGATEGGIRFMCLAVDDAALALSVCPRKAASAFAGLLREHGVSASGLLTHKNRQNDPHLHRTIEAQTIRFDFLNLLAESLDDTND